MHFDKSKFIGQFKAETKEHIQNLNQGLLKLEKNPEDKNLAETLMREAHTIKGSAMMMDYKKIADIAHKMEDDLQKSLNQKILLEKNHFDLLFRCLDTLETILEDEGSMESAKKTSSVFAPLKKPVKKSPSTEETTRVSISRLDKLINLSGELIISKIQLHELIQKVIEKRETHKDSNVDFEQVVKGLKSVYENIKRLEL